MMLDQLWFSIRIIKTTLLESIPAAERFDAPAKMQNRAITGTRRFVTPSSTLRTAARPERKRSEGPIRADQFEFVARDGRTPHLFSSGASRHARDPITALRSPATAGRRRNDSTLQRLYSVDSHRP